LVVGTVVTAVPLSSLPLPNCPLKSAPQHLAPYGEPPMEYKQANARPVTTVTGPGVGVTDADEVRVRLRLGPLLGVRVDDSDFDGVREAVTETDIEMEDVRDLVGVGEAEAVLEAVSDLEVDLDLLLVLVMDADDVGVLLGVMDFEEDLLTLFETVLLAENDRLAETDGVLEVDWVGDDVLDAAVTEREPVADAAVEEVALRDILLVDDRDTLLVIEILAVLLMDFVGDRVLLIVGITEAVTDKEALLVAAAAIGTDASCTLLGLSSISSCFGCANAGIESAVKPVSICAVSPGRMINTHINRQTATKRPSFTMASGAFT
jgi:hypothetical protein